MTIHELQGPLGILRKLIAGRSHDAMTTSHNINDRTKMVDNVS